MSVAVYEQCFYMLDSQHQLWHIRLVSSVCPPCTPWLLYVNIMFVFAALERVQLMSMSYNVTGDARTA